MRVGPWRRLSAKAFVLLNCGTGEDFWDTPLHRKEIKPANKGNTYWIFIGRTDAETEAPILWLPKAESQFIGKDPDMGKDWGQEEKVVTEDEIVVWHHWLNVHEFEQTLRDSEGEGRLACCSPWVCKSWTWLTNWTTRRGE